MQWPTGFMWGTGASSTQCEGAAPASDWADWEAAGRAPSSGDGNGFATRHPEDFAILASLGLTHHRLSIEWARVEPEPGVHDQAEVERYRALLVAAHEAGITPWVSLHHFTLPRWFAAAGGFTVEANRTGPWTRHVDWMAETFGDLVGGWQPVNEANLYALLHYGGFGFPPGHDNLEETALVDEQIQLANAEAAVRLKQTGRPVASIFGLAVPVAQDDDPATQSMIEFLDQGLWRPGIDLFRDGVLRARGRAPIERPDLAGSFDLIGFSYYMALGVKGGSLAPHPVGARLSPLGYGIFPEGLGLVLDRLHAELPGTPLLVAEFGIGTADDTERADYLARGLKVIQDALSRGVDVRGLFHWTAVDNYEWLHGYDPTAAFGIIDRDRNVRASASVIAEQARGAAGNRGT
ncbi:MAG: family 1 glycosylhydrolase [Ilumatobacteraceae bacterium]